MQLYKKISAANRIKYGTEAEKVLEIIINQYSDRTHFIYEILQNAEDAGASQIRFHLTPNALEIYHNGRPFNEKDIEGVCGIANGTKADGTRIGHFGIGFKSVYCYTEVPVICSGPYHFAIKNQLFPEETAAKPGLGTDETCMILPFNKPEVSPQVAYQEIKDALLRKIHAESILILDNIREVKTEVDGYPDTITISKIKNPIGSLEQGRVYALGMRTLVTNHKGKNAVKDADYLFFTDSKREASALVFKVDGADGKTLCPIRNAKVYAFFPTAKEAHQNFYIHAPFDTTPARDNFKEGAEYGRHNIALVDHICELINDSLLWMRDNGYLSFEGFNTVFPIYEYEETDILHAIYQNSVDVIASGVELLPTNQPGVYKSIDNICVPAASAIVDVFTDDDLHQLVSYRLNWLAKEISTEAYAGLKSFLKSNANFQTLEWKDLVLRMNAEFLQRKSLAWMERLMDRIETYCIRRSSRDSHFVNAAKIPFVRLADGRQICAKDESGHLQVYLNNHSAARYQIDEAFLRSNTVRRFYQNALEIPEYNIEQETLEKILPKYVTADVKFRTENPARENIEDLKTIKDAVYTNPAILDKVKDKYVVTDGQKWYQPSQLYIRSVDIRSGYSLVRDYVQIHYLSDSYFSNSTDTLKLDEDFFRKIGCNRGIRLREVSKEDYLRAVRKYQGAQAAEELRTRIFSKRYISPKLNWAFCYEGFPAVFQNMTKQKSLQIARFLNPNTVNFDVKGELVGADDQQFSGRNVDSAAAYSMLGLQLCFEPWIYVNGEEQPKRPIDVDKDDLLPEYRQASRLINVLPCKEVKNAFTAWLDANVRNTGDRDLIKKYLSKPEELAKIAKTLAKSEAREEAKKGKGRSIQDLIRSADKGQQGKGISPDGIEIHPISEKGKEKREQNLDRLLAESMHQQIKVARGLTFASRSSNKEERAFLLAEYSGVCQICEKSIVKHDGEAYFEAINVIKFSEMLAKYAQANQVGWNSLCLCPNCAAEYNNCSKKISTLYDQVMNQDAEPGSEEPILIEIELPEGSPKRIHYSPRHFIALKEALKIFSQAQE